MNRKIFQRTQFLRAAHTPEQWAKDGKPEIVFLGRSNVGKSSLINSLAGRRELARTAQTPGKTRQVIYYDVDGVFYLCDLPGYGFARGRRGKTGSDDFRAMVDAYLDPSRPFARVLLLLDIRHEPSQMDKQMLAWLIHHEMPLTLVFTKGDKLSRQKQNQQLTSILAGIPDYSDLEIFSVSNVTKEGIQDLQDHIVFVVSHVD